MNAPAGLSAKAGPPGTTLGDLISGNLYCDICFHRHKESYHAHKARHLRENPHTFCRTIKCDNGDDCPVEVDSNT